MAFKMRGWSPFNQFAGSDYEDTVSELEEEQSKEEQWVDKSKEDDDTKAFPRQEGETLVEGSLEYIKGIRERLGDVQDRITDIETADYPGDKDKAILVSLRTEEARLMNIINK